MRIHSLASGATIMSLSPHGFKFSDGTESEPQDSDLVKAFTLKREYVACEPVAGMGVNSMKMVLSEEQLSKLAELASSVDVVIAPFPVLVSLRESGIRDSYPNVLAFNATAETMRSAPQDKIVDINNWSY